LGLRNVSPVISALLAFAWRARLSAGLLGRRWICGSSALFRKPGWTFPPAAASSWRRGGHLFARHVAFAKPSRQVGDYLLLPPAGTCLRETAVVRRSTADGIRMQHYLLRAPLPTILPLDIAAPSVPASCPIAFSFKRWSNLVTFPATVWSLPSLPEGLLACAGWPCIPWQIWLFFPSVLRAWAGRTGAGGTVWNRKVPLCWTFTFVGLSVPVEEAIRTGQAALVLRGDGGLASYFRPSWTCLM